MSFSINKLVLPLFFDFTVTSHYWIIIVGASRSLYDPYLYVQWHVDFKNTNSIIRIVTQTLAAFVEEFRTLPGYTKCKLLALLVLKRVTITYGIVYCTHSRICSYFKSLPSLRTDRRHSTVDVAGWSLDGEHSSLNSHIIPLMVFYDVL